MARARRTATEAPPALEIRPLAKDEWDDVEALFGANGACGGCWCMHWRVARGGREWEASKGARNRAAMRSLVRAGAVDAVIARVDGAPVAWCSFGPRASFPRLAGSRVLRRDAPATTWSIVCFYVPARWRGRGVASRLLAAATERAFELGASEVEGFPVPVRAGTRMPAAFAWTGVAELFERAGYAPIARARGLRPIWVRARRTSARARPR